MASPISQVGWFYNGRWTQANETMVLLKLEYLTWSHKWIPGSKTSKAELLRGVRNELREEWNFYVDQEEIERKVQEWEVRYRNFKDLIMWPGVCYRESTNTVRASERLWDEIAESRRDLFVYMDEGEINWDLLKKIFAETVVVSSDAGDAKQVPAGTSASGRSSKRKIEILSDDDSRI